MIRRFVASFSYLGVILGIALFCASLTPSLLPRTPVVQGVLAGVVFAAGYALGHAGLWIWRFMGLRSLRGRPARIATWILLAVLTLLAIYTLNRMTVWQNSVRLRMAMDPIDSAYPWSVLLVSVVTALAVVLIVRLVLFVAAKLVSALGRIFPRRVAIVLGGTAFALLLLFLVNGIILRAAIRGLDESFAAMNRLLDEEYDPPQDDRASGSAQSLIAWDDIGRNGKRYLVHGPTKEEIAGVLGREAMQPIRVYAGFDTGDTLEERAEIALAELKRVGGFDRSTLIIATPTGTGWLDPSAVNPIEFLLGGDVATVTLQYSYLPSWLTLMVTPEVAGQAARALFQAVYRYWAGLPKDDRPRLYLFGLSLGAHGSAISADVLTMLSDPVHGALWTGPPFSSTLWRSMTRNREPGSPEWRPVFRDSSLVRVMTQDGFPDLGDAAWGPVRIVYLQHASDPMTFFSPGLAYAQPDWLGPDRGRDVSPYLDWRPVVTFFQVAFDIPMATTPPLGYGHNFAPSEYIDAWIEVVQPANWSAADTEKLKAHFADFNPSPL